MRLIESRAKEPIRSRMPASAVFPAPLRDYVGGDLDAVRWRSVAGGVRQAILDRMATHALARPEPFLRRIEAPVLLLWGEQDRMVPAAHAADYERELKDRRTVILPGLGHVPMEEDPARSAAAVMQFLSE